MTAPTSITSEIQKLAPSAVVELFELDATAYGAGIQRFHAGTNGLTQPIVWQGVTYAPYPIEVKGFEYNGNGQLPRPTMRIANITGGVTSLVLAYNDLLGAKLTRKRTLVKYLDSVNFPAPNATNLAKWSQDLSQSTYSKFGGSIVSTSVIAPDNVSSFFNFVPSTTLQNHYMRMDSGSFFSSLQVGAVYTVSVYVKNAGYRYFHVRANTSGDAEYCIFDFNTGTIIDGTANSYSVQALGNGVFRISLKFVNLYSANWIFFNPSPAASGNTFFTGDGTSGVYVWGVQVESGLLTDYVATTGTSTAFNPTADPTAAFDDDVFYIDRKANENREIVEFELAASIDLQGVMLPKRQVVQNVCPWKYKGTECGYSGTNYYTAADVATTAANDVCGKRLTSCKLRFGTYAALPFGGFPAAGLIK